MINDSIAPPTPRALVIRRTFAAPLARVYTAWTKADDMRRWFGPGECTVTEFELDFRIGGTYRVAMQRPDGERFVVRGQYREIVERERLVYTWRWDEDVPEDEFDTLVTVEFHEAGSSTEIVVRHDFLRSEESVTNHEHGWNATLDNLVAFLAR